MPSKKKTAGSKPAARKKARLRDLPTRGRVTSEQAMRIKGGDDPPPSPDPTKLPPPP